MDQPAARPARRHAWALVALALAVLVAAGTWTRIGIARADPNFRTAPPQGRLRSDPALLYYFVERIQESGGVPADLCADPRIEHPDSTDIPALFPIGPEFLIAGARQLFWSRTALPEFCLYASSLCASLFVVGVYLLARALGAGRGLGLAAALFAALLPANYRTVGFLLVGEDYSLPLFALHVGLAARAAREPTKARVLAAAAAGLLSLATWHAASFFLAIEAAAIFLGFWWRGWNPFCHPNAVLGLGLLVAGGLAVPVLRHTCFVLSLPMQLFGGLTLAAVVLRRGGSRRSARIGALAGTLLLLGASLLVSRQTAGGLAGYSHVFGLLWHKLIHLGALPEDPGVLPFEVRLMWQGPFATLAPASICAWLGVGTLALAMGAREVWRARRGAGVDAVTCVVCLGACLSLPLAWLIERTLVLPGLLAAPLGAAWLARLAGPRRSGLAAGFVLLQAVLFVGQQHGRTLGWYHPAVRQEELARLVDAVPRLLPDGAAVAADFVNGPALLAQTGHPILFQPKWEARRSRERIERFLAEFFRGTPASLSRMLREEFDCRYLLVDRAQLVLGCRYAAGVRPGEPLGAGTPAALFASESATELTGVPGYRLLYRSPADLRQVNGRPSDLYRLYELLAPAR